MPPRRSSRSEYASSPFRSEAIAMHENAIRISTAKLRSLSAAKGNRASISVYGQGKLTQRQRLFGLAQRARRVRLRGQQPRQSNATTRRLAVANLAIRGIEADIGKEHTDTFRHDRRGDYALANPPFSESNRFHKDDDMRWRLGVQPKGNANFAWMQHFIHQRNNNQYVV